MSFSTDSSSKASKSLLTHCGVQLWLHQCHFRKVAVGRSNGTGFVANGIGRIWKWGRGAPVRCGPENFFVMVSTVCCLQFMGAPVPYGVGATVCGYALRDSDKSLTLAALTRLFGCGLPRTSVLCFNLPLPPIFFENSSDLHQSRDWPCRRLRGQLPPFAPRDDANDQIISFLFHHVIKYWSLLLRVQISWQIEHYSLCLNCWLTMVRVSMFKSMCLVYTSLCYRVDYMYYLQ